MDRIVFQPELPVTPVDLTRSDVACFVGLARLAKLLVEPTDTVTRETGSPVALSEVRAGDVLEVGAGELIPLDGVVIDGASFVDEAAITGRAELVLKAGMISPQLDVRAAWRNVTATLTIRPASDGPVYYLEPGDVVPETGDGVVLAGASLMQVPGPSSRLLSWVGNSVGERSVIAGTRNVTAPLRIRAKYDGKPVAQLPPTKREWLRNQGWIEGPYARDCADLHDIPVPIENYPAFTALFDDGTGDGAVGTDYVAAAVRSFFAQGGKRCYVVRVGDPIGKDSTLQERTATREALLGRNVSEQDQGSWSAIGHLHGLPDVSFLLLPDFPALHATSIEPAKPQEVEIPAGPEQFVRCIPLPPEPAPKDLRAFPAPRLSVRDFDAWSRSIREVVNFLAPDRSPDAQFATSRRLREVQFVAALPLPFDELLTPSLAAAEAWPNGIQEIVTRVFSETVGRDFTSSAFLQLAYPWLVTVNPAPLLQSLEPPDGALAGLLARNALARGTFASAAKVTPVAIVDLFPQLPLADTRIPERPLTWNSGVAKPLVTRVSLFGFTPLGIRLLSDVTTYPGESYRQGRVNRLVSVISRTARLFGESHVFENNGPALWRQLEHTLVTFLTRLWELGALEGGAPADAFQVQCDRGTMTQNDVDNGRLIAVVQFRAAGVIERIQVTLTVSAAPASDFEIEAQMAEVR